MRNKIGNWPDIFKNSDKISKMKIISVDDCFASQDDVSTDCTSDELLARMLQEKFDDEYCQAQPRDGRTINHPVKICPAEDLEDDEILDEQAEHIKAFESRDKK